MSLFKKEYIERGKRFKFLSLGIVARTLEKIKHFDRGCLVYGLDDL